MGTGFFSHGRGHQRKSPPVGVFHLEERPPLTTEYYRNGMYTPQISGISSPAGKSGEQTMMMGIGADAHLAVVPIQDSSGYFKNKTVLVMGGVAE